MESQRSWDAACPGRGLDGQPAIRAGGSGEGRQQLPGKDKVGMVACAGLCFPQAWMFVVSKGLVFEGLGFQFAFHMGLCLCLVAVAALTAWRSGPTVRGRTAMAAVSALGMAALPALGLAGAGALDDASMAMGLVSGASVALSFSLWFVNYSCLPLRLGFSFVLLGFSGGALGCLVLSAVAAVSVGAVLAIACVLPFLSWWALRRSLGWASAAGCAQEAADATACGSGESRASSSLKHIVFLLVQIVIYAVVFGNGIIFSILQNGSVDVAHKAFIGPLNYGFRFLFPLLMLAWFRSQNQPEHRVYRSVANAVLLGLVFVLLGFWFLGGANTIIAYSMVSLARNLVLILIYLVLLQLVHATGRRPLLIFGVGRGLYEASVACGIAGYAALRAQVGPIAIEEGAVYLTAFCVFVFLASCLLATLQSLGEFQDDDPTQLREEPDGEGAATQAPGEGSKADDDAGERRLRSALSETFQLTEREIEMTLLFSRGNSKKRIAEMLVLSENTVRWYLQQIYVKLGVHSRDELIELVSSLSQE